MQGDPYGTHELIDHPSTALERAALDSHAERLDIKTQRVSTVSQATAEWMSRAMADTVRGKRVVEIGSGKGFLAVELAKVASWVLAVEVDPLWSREFATTLYVSSRKNLIWALAPAESLLESGIARGFRPEVAVVVTGSDEERLRVLAERFVGAAGEIIMPWQMWNRGTAVIGMTDPGKLKDPPASI